MKKFIYMSVLYFIAMAGCAKNEFGPAGIAAKSSSTEVTGLPLTVPTLPGYTPPEGIEPGQPIPFPNRPDTVPQYNDHYNVFASPDTDFIKTTCLFTISHLDEGSTYHQVNNKKLNLAFYSGDKGQEPFFVRRLKPTTPYPYGWTAHWNSLSAVENEHPEVLLTNRFESEFMIVLSKPCTKFSFEMAPNVQNYLFELVFNWGNYFRDDNVGYWVRDVQTPSGAVVVGIETQVPFTVITVIFLKYSLPLINPEGMAIADIRYKLAE
jgi:hypothetical protein